ncbi:orotidine-5'-phosphate decarboxylase [Desulfocurvibacter africanus PCS]|uniref:Orotidine 5'-phosphate decarboxylase n=1 Tax=Desulfocurvibacter africanus PCS TaxID=1262666 RepID=M5Q1R4_DESAF|nr:orotidine-5'-phosphate decarboxylase [Desulfocurvibacter africanus]EMG36778.1 orotidine-5'-phosphate decarboxylase [Desulfocurvibacter africanus PCS]
MAELIIALDFPHAEQALSMARTMRGEADWVKIGLELFTAAGPRVVTDMKELGLKVFLDLKFHDIPNTVRGAVRSAANLGVDMLTLHASGGRAMLEAAREASLTSRQSPLLFAVTVLTSMSAEDTALLGRSDVPELVRDLARASGQAGLDGVVCSALEAKLVKEDSRGKLACLTPGIRLAASPDGARADDQKRVADPAFAVTQGSDYLVVGRPITGAQDPAAAIRAFQRAMAEAGPARGRPEDGAWNG